MKIIGICGATASGKTTLASSLGTKLSNNFAVISQDSFYRDQSHLDIKQRKLVNYDHPDAIDFKLLISILKKLFDGKNVEIPQYCFASHSIISKTVKMNPPEVLIVEGTMIFTQKEILNKFNFKLFMDIPSDIRLAYRIKRDVIERGRVINDVIEQYFLSVRPMTNEYVTPQKKVADILVNEFLDTKGISKLANFIINDIKPNELQNV